MEYPSASADHDVSPVSSIEHLPSLSAKPSVTASHRASRSPRRGRPSHRQSHDGARDVSSPSTTSSHPEGLDYCTDITTPAASVTGAEDEVVDDIEMWRAREYPMIKGNVYLDNGGAAIPCKSFLMSSALDACHNLYGNPHSTSAPSALSSHRVSVVRQRLLHFFNASPESYSIIFTANATASIKLVAESLSDHARKSNTAFWYGYHKDAHTSLVGVRALATQHRCFNSDSEVERWIGSGGLGGPRPRQMGLFAYPGQSNMSGRRLPTGWCRRISEGMKKARTYTMLDAAALASTAQLDLSDPAESPDFVALSLYKIFGKPHVGCLLVKNSVAEIFESRRYFGGGTVEMVVSDGQAWHAKKSDLASSLEDGTVPFHSIVEIGHAIDAMEALWGKMPMRAIGAHTGALGKRMWDSAMGLRHSNGAALVRAYKDEEASFGDSETQGSTLAFNVLDPEGRLWGYETIESTLNDAGIFVRSGSLCNPGGMTSHLGWTGPQMRSAYDAGHRCSEPVQVIFGKPTGVVRASIGTHNIADDVDRFICFLEETYLNVDLVAHGAEHQGHVLPLSEAGKQGHVSSNSTSTHSTVKPLSPTTQNLSSRSPLLTLTDPRSDSVASSLPKSSTSSPNLLSSFPNPPTVASPTVGPSSPDPVALPLLKSPSMPFSTLDNALSTRTAIRKSLHDRVQAAAEGEARPAVPVVEARQRGRLRKGEGQREEPGRKEQEREKEEDSGDAVSRVTGASRRRFGKVAGLLGKGRR
ncbi:Molybdenum cofactor sulfurase [Sphaceloma murrayae]|uniref:Molybdenum cofactor sulfurase n=1 Tax=Sphaceloma murrayae TaxID=2082308 RepID=A0A2K1QIV2_9PEZI|nr:Molybdenum cofactor sulfurase [Sphaceloma murrayae]